MDALTETARQEQELHLLTEWGGDRTRSREAVFGSIALHVVGLLALLAVPKDAWVNQPRAGPHRQTVTPLIAPPVELTQKAPNRGQIAKSFTAESLMPKPRIQVPKAPPSVTRPAAPKPAELAQTLPPPPAPAVPEPPKIEPAPTPTLPPPQQPQIQPQEKPKLAFENPHAQPPPTTPTQPGRGKLTTPNSSVNEAMRGIARGSSGGGITVGDLGVGSGGIGEALNMPPSPGKVGSNLELLSDPMGVDFKPYLVRILANVRRNWFAIMPESAKLGRRGKVSIQFSIDREGRVPKLVIAMSSGAEALDRAAVAGISASNPFPPLPTEFKGGQIRLQFNFAYNIPVN